MKTKKLLLTILFIFNVVVLFNLKADAQVTGFVQRSGSKLILNGKTFRFAGADAYWLGVDDNGQGPPSTAPIPALSPHCPTLFEVDDALKTAVEMGANVIRSHTLGASTGCANCIEPSLNNFNSAALQQVDYCLKRARELGIRVIMPLTDNYHYDAGGKHFYTDWRGITNEDMFFTDTIVINDFKQFTSTILNHVNSYTGIAYKNDSTILAWETGNELNTTATWGSAQDNWTQIIASYIKSIDVNHLVADGHNAENNSSGNFSISQLQNSSVDMYTDHFYPPDISIMKSNATLAAQNNKVYYIGEYDWTDKDHTPAAGSISQDGTTSEVGNYSANIHVTKTNSNQVDDWWIQLLSNTYNLQGNTTYTVTFYAKASNNNYIEANLQQDAYPYPVYANQTYNLTSSWTQYSFTYTPTSNLSPVYLNFSLAQDTGNIWFDNISVSGGSSGNLINNNSFETTGNGWLSPWIFQVQPLKGDSFAAFIPAIEATTGVSGDLYWDLRQHGCYYGFVGNGDSYALHYPGDNPDMKNRVDTLKNHAFRMKGVSPVDSVPSAPLLTWINDVIAWRGQAYADKYAVERAFSNTGPWTLTCNQCADDNQTPWTDATRPSGQTVWYRIKAYNISGVAGPYSSPAISLGNNSALVDNLNDWSKSVSHTANLSFDHSNINYCNGDSSRIYRTSAANEEIVWQLNNMTIFQAITYFWTSEPVSHFSFYTSADNISWTSANPALIMGGLGNWVRYEYTLDSLKGVNYVKMRWNNTSGQSWSPQIGKVMIDNTVTTGINRINENEKLVVYPNPTSGETTISYSLSENSNVKITMYDVLGKEVKQLIEEKQSAGTYQLNFNTAGLQSSIYFIKATINRNEVIEKFVVCKN